MMAQLKKLLFLILIAPLFTNAQNYKPGFVVNLKGDTIKGLIDFKEWENTPTSINFKQSINNQTIQKFTVDDVNFFEISGFTSYKAFKVSISLDVTNLQRLQANKDTSSKVDNVFLKIISQGNNVTLFSYADNLKDRFYIYNSLNKSINELIYRIYYANNITTADVTTNNKVKTEEAYKQQLLLIAQQFSTYRPSLINQLERANYAESDLIDICSKINSNTILKPKSSGSKGKYVKFFIGGGASFNSISSGGGYEIYAQNKVSNSVSPFINVGINLFRVPEIGATLLRIELLYYKVPYKIEGDLYYIDPSRFETYTFDQNNFCIYPQLQYHFYNTNKLKAFANIGIQYIAYRYSNNIITIPSRSSDNHYYDPDFLRSTYLFPIKTGLVLKKHYEISLSYTYKTPLTVSESSSNSLGYTSFSAQSIKLGFNYLF